MYGVFAYMILGCINLFFPAFTARFHIQPDKIPLLNPSNIGTSGIDPITIAAASLIGFIQGILIAININTSFFMQIFRHLGVTKRFSDPDVWSFLLNSQDTDNWVTIRHPGRGHIYQGYVRSFSGGEKDRELVLTLVEVFDLETAVKVGEIPILYLAFKKDDLVLEFGAKPAPDGSEMLIKWSFKIGKYFFGIGIKKPT